jgi:hypothetical protein
LQAASVVSDPHHATTSSIACDPITHFQWIGLFLAQQDAVVSSMHRDSRDGLAFGYKLC